MNRESSCRSSRSRSHLCDLPARRGELRPQFRLRPGRDDAVLDWLTSLAPRERSRAIRRALRDHVTALRVKGATWEEDPELAAALDALF